MLSEPCTFLETRSCADTAPYYVALLDRSADLRGWYCGKGLGISCVCTSAITSKLVIMMELCRLKGFPTDLITYIERDKNGTI